MSAALVRLLAVCASLFAVPLHAQERVSVAYPGPLTISFLPLELAPKIGADAAEGLQLVLRHTTGGGAAIQQMLNRNVDFVVAGLPAAMSAKSSGGDVVAIGALNDLPVFVLSVRSDLKGQVKRPRDLAGRVIGVTTSSLAVKTISQQLAELLLESDGVPSGQIRIVPAGQSWEEHSAKLRSGSADAIMGFEPVASRLAEAGLAFPLFNLGDPADAARIPGAGLLHGTLMTRSDLLREAPQRAEKMVAVMRRTLQWMAGRSPEEIVAKLEVADAGTRATLLKLLARYPRLYSPDGKFSERQLRETAAFYNAGEGAARPIAVDKVVDARWAGRKP
jgi:NitT/TauT family transport system substrate-binding protein